MDAPVKNMICILVVIDSCTEFIADHKGAVFPEAVNKQAVPVIMAATEGGYQRRDTNVRDQAELVERQSALWSRDMTARRKTIPYAGMNTSINAAGKYTSARWVHWENWTKFECRLAESRKRKELQAVHDKLLASGSWKPQYHHCQRTWSVVGADDRSNFGMNETKQRGQRDTLKKGRTQVKRERRTRRKKGGRRSKERRACRHEMILRTGVGSRVDREETLVLPLAHAAPPRRSVTDTLQTSQPVETQDEREVGGEGRTERNDGTRGKGEERGNWERRIPKSRSGQTRAQRRALLRGGRRSKSDANALGLVPVGASRRWETDEFEVVDDARVRK
ncbi:hypothetical protein DFH06DRAFT_1136886 [Mycena polygramma]|nr:hypothetical protein DFH06DRAFT_1136886 [Mycena polygramma]